MISMTHYILDDKKELVAVDLPTCCQWFENINNTIVRNEYINDYRISTIFLGHDHDWDESSKPLIFETMIFSPDGNDVYMRRYRSWKDAEEGHIVACEWAKSGACAK